MIFWWGCAERIPTKKSLLKSAPPFVELPLMRISSGSEGFGALRGVPKPLLFPARRAGNSKGYSVSRIHVN